MKRRIVFGLVLGVFAVAGLAANGKKDAAGGAPEPYVIWVNPLIGSAVFTSADEGLQAAGKEFGFRVKITGHSGIDEVAYVQALENAIVEKPAAILLCPYNYPAFERTLAKARSQGIAIVNINMDSPPAERLTVTGTDNTVYGRLAADYIAKQKNGKANVLVMMAGLSFANQLEQKTAFEAAISEKYPDMKVVITDEDRADSVVAVQKFTDILRAHPEIDTIFCLESIGGAAAAVVLKEQNLVGKVTILAIDDNADTLQYIRDGVIWGTMAQNFYKAGYAAGEAVIKNLKGEKVPSTIDAGTVLITRDNINTYKDELK
jgi:ABC-type sugar transport system substrate-binding protein